MADVKGAADIAAILGNAKQVGDEIICTCVLADEHAHGDRDPSLSLRDADGKVLAICRTKHKDQQDRIIEALKARGLWPSRNGNGASNSPGASPRKKEYRRVVPIPADAMKHDVIARFVKFLADTKVARPGRTVDDSADAFEYRDLGGALQFCVLRFDYVDKSEDGQETPGKDCLPATWWLDVATGKARWRSKWPEGKRSLFGLQRLPKHPDLPRLLLEGEGKTKKADKIIGDDYLALGLAGGSGAVSKNDFMPLAEGPRTTYWPDNDEPGFKAALDTTAAIVAVRGKVLETPLIVKPDPSWPVGHDIKNLIEEGWTREQLLEYIAQHTVSISEFEAEAARRFPKAEPANTDNQASKRILDQLDRTWAVLQSEPGFTIRLNDGKVVTVKRFCDATAPLQTVRQGRKAQCRT